MGYVKRKDMLCCEHYKGKDLLHVPCIKEMDYLLGPGTLWCTVYFVRSFGPYCTVPMHGPHLCVSIMLLSFTDFFSRVTARTL